MTKKRASKRKLRVNGKPCTYCARPMRIDVPEVYPTHDHFHPKSQGGRIKVWSCYVCNAVKRDMTEDEWAIYRFEHDFWWQEGRRAEKAIRGLIPRAERLKKRATHHRESAPLDARTYCAGGAEPERSGVEQSGSSAGS